MQQVQVRQGNGVYQPTNLENLDGMPFKDYSKFVQGRIKQARNHKRRDTLRILAGTTIPARERSLFNVPYNNKTETADGGTEYLKSRADTNMKEANKLEFGNLMLIDSVQVIAAATAREFNTLVAGEPTDLTPAAEGTTSASNTIIGLGLNVGLDFSIGDETKSEGLLVDYPSDSVFSGSFGGNADEGFAQFGYGHPRYFDQVILMRAGEFFTVTLDFLNPIIVPQSLNLIVQLCGVNLGPVG